MLGDATRPLVLHVVSASEMKHSPGRVAAESFGSEEAVDSAATSISFLSSVASMQRVVLGMNFNCGHDSQKQRLFSSCCLLSEAQEIEVCVCVREGSLQVPLQSGTVSMLLMHSLNAILPNSCNVIGY